MPTEVHGLCSMATRALLADLGNLLSRTRPLEVRFEPAGGVDVVRSIRAGARADLAVLGQEQLAGLAADGLLLPGTLTSLFVSDVVAAVATAAAGTPLSTEEDLRSALTGAGRIAFSTGPSGHALLDLVDRWELTEVVRPKLVRADPGSPVGALLAGGEADLGFQQRSELVDVPGVSVLGPLPGAAAIRSTFSGAVLARSAAVEAAREVLDFLGSEDAEREVVAAGMTRA